MMTHRDDGPRQRREVDHHSLMFVVKIFRDLVIFLLGAYAFYNEIQRTGAVRTELLVMSGAMMGLPIIIRGDERRQEAKSIDSQQKGSRDGAAS